MAPELVGSGITWLESWLMRSSAAADIVQDPKGKQRKEGKTKKGKKQQHTQQQKPPCSSCSFNFEMNE